MTKLPCRCGAIELEITGKPVSQVYCHCEDCQAAHAAAYALNAVYPAQAVKITKGKPVPLVIKTTPRMRCASCGTFLFTEVLGAELRSLNAYLLPKGEFNSQLHLHCADAVLPIADTLPHYADLPAAFGGSDKLVEW